jgi:site-specific DNA recombinase
MRAAIYARVSTSRQAWAQKIDQQLERLKGYAERKGWTLEDEHVYPDEGYGGATLNRPGLDALRDAAAMAEFEVVLITAPDGLARKYVHQILLIEELQGHGCKVEFVERPMSQDPNDQLLLQIRGAVAEYERALIAERMRRGRLAKLRAGRPLPWVRIPFGYRTDPEHQRDPAGLRIDEYEAAIVRQMFAWYLERGATLGSIARRLIEGGVPTPTGKRDWSRSTIRSILKNPTYVGEAYGNRIHLVPARRRKSPLTPVGSGVTCKRRPEEEWFLVSVPAIVDPKIFEVVAEKLSRNRKHSARNNKSHRYLLRSLVGCGACASRVRTPAPPGTGAATTSAGGTTRFSPGHRCRTRHVPAARLDQLVWEDLRVRCSAIRSTSGMRYGGRTEENGCLRNSRRS